MPCDGIFIHHLTVELKDLLCGGKINKIIEPSNLDIILQIRAKNQDGKILNHQLLISSSLDMPRIYITNKKYTSLDIPKNFCMVLRKYIERGVILDICQYQNDRLILIKIASNNELGDSNLYTLAIELMGRNSNVILLDKDEIIIDAMRKLPPNEDVTRLIIPHAKYQYPTSESSINPFELSDNDIYDESLLQGVCKQVRFTIKNHNISIVDYLNNTIKPTIYNLDKKYDFYILPLEGYNVVKNNFNTISEMLDVYYNEYKQIYTDKAKALKKVVKNKITHFVTKLDNLEKDLEDANKNLVFNKLGVLLQANLYKVSKGMKKVIVEDFIDNSGEIEINLDEMLDPGKNLKRIFQKGKKAKNAIDMVQIQIDLTNKEIAYLDSIYSQIDFASPIDLDEIRDELVKNKYIKQQKLQKPKNKKINITKYYINDNTILVGKNNIQNDYITHHLAKSYDWWFHVKDAPGSHVVFKMPSPEYVLTEQDIRYCANLAASFSKASTSSSVPVDYLQIKYIKKIPGTKGCEVTYTNQKTIYIDPDIKF